jgi:uncharacterized protein (DUF302 family)
MKELAYGLGVEVELPFDQAKSIVIDALRDQGFGILTEIDVTKTMKEKLGADFPRYVILGACNPALAHEALEKDMNLGMLLPCNVVVRQENHSFLISVLDPLVMSRMSGAPGIEEIALKARRNLEVALERAFDAFRAFEVVGVQ